MARDKVICAIDVGSSKIATLIASIGDELPGGGRSDKINLIGVSATPSKGVKKGQVVDIDDAVEAITESVEAAERMAGYSISSGYISLGGPQIESINQHAVVAVAQPEGEIKDGDVLRVNEAARAIPLPSSREILHVIPRTFTVDGQEGIRDPVGMTGVRLETETHIITGSSTSMRNLVKCVQQVGIDVVELVFGGIASSFSILTDTEKELGVILVDIGGETTDVVIFVDGSVSYSAVVPIGARHITSDLAVGLRVSLESAEKIKLSLGKIQKPAVDEERVEIPKKKDELLDIKSLGLAEDVKEISRKAVVEGIIRPRLQEIFKYVGKEIKKSGFGNATPSGLVICGGGALTAGVLDQAKYILGFPARVGKINGLSGLIDEIDTPQYSAAAGLILYGVNQTGQQGESRIPVLASSIPIKGMVQKGMNWVKSLLP
ncbi:cell division protein FtsA [Candidatus Daviesbacteria bacterium RIFCSPHIGHO2_12_FULL_37_11]|uniref:Cell division protein FtsA n=1 Tax=Candidatus Daviesbacteria bacterium RIFCSPHIGHO2_12_FULL_37_11 TaxID=1797777 RepID=A0A1F5KBI6_9BACT|nr:MAG: cell division protein FtsA [Candidatus Daviesbacteria bacterium GWA1_38_6]OGE16994.1 MAG: cell division protein FtsA [Candidatus Daviesbacteria bacterium RIFCSPHIGHO2_01_FULL_37_27]OGE38296.1 MAG: cell division protein FtsA [Candidatus Daviesbacteria bacterium RIFCSPHIGHO2_12_FULL_37_11]OGE46252.1 MAG: cell division protein FtsA [Candidatus Daviesbacteria bacterium RIFCSPLOWO2_01_FULL_37_10]